MRFKLSLTPEAKALGFSEVYLLGIPKQSISLIVETRKMTDLLNTKRMNLSVVMTLVLAPLLSRGEETAFSQDSASLQGPLSFGIFCPAIAIFVESRKKDTCNLVSLK